MENLSFLIEELLQCKVFLILLELSACFDFLCLVKSPCLKLVVEHLEVFSLLWMHPPLDLFLMLLFFLVPELILPSKELLLLVIASLPLTVRKPRRKPPPHMALYIEGGLLPLSLPHLAGEVRPRVHDLVLPLIDVYIALLHLRTELAHHDRRLRLVLIRLNDPLIALGVIARGLVCLCERVVVTLAGLGVPETAYVCLRTALFLDLDGHDLDLVVSEPNLDLEHGRHDELVGLYGVEVVLLLLLLLLVHLPTRDVHLLLLLLLLLPRY